MADVLTLIQSQSHTDHKRRNTVVITLISLLCLALLAGVIYASGNVKPFLPPQTAAKHLQSWMNDLPIFKARDGSRAQIYHKEEIRKLYKKNRHRLIWFDSFEMKPSAHLLIQSLRETVADDRHLYSYQIPAILDAVNNLTNLPKDVTALDILLSEAYLTFAQDTQNNLFLPDLDSHDHAPEYKQAALAPEFKKTSEDILEQLMDNLPESRLMPLIDSLTPSQPGYLKLRTELVRYQEIISSGQWRKMPDGPDVALNEKHQDIRILRNTLLMTGDLEASALDKFFGDELTTISDDQHSYHPDSPEYKLDHDLSVALTKYQHRHGLDESGFLDQTTRTQLQISPERIARTIAYNMKRWRHLPENLGDRYLMVNMANYWLELVENGEVTTEMKVITGRPARRTPTLVDPMRTVVLNPTWTVPRRIATNDILPKVKRDVAYLARQNLQVFRNLKDGSEQIIDPYTVDWSKINRSNLRYRFRQTPGKDNALGEVKFTLPNNMSIYLHDTNHPELFAKKQRALSSGCIRVEKPILLAEKLLATKKGWTSKHIGNVLNSRRTTYVPLAKPIPTYLLYFTAWVDDSGNLQMRPDVYQWDQLDRFGSDKNAGMIASSMINTLSP